MYDHARSSRFNGEFEITVLNSFDSRKEAEYHEELYINYFKTFENGLNETPSGKGFGHNSPKFTTLGFAYSEKSKQKMSESAKNRAKREGKEKRSLIAKRGWINGGSEYRKYMSDIRKGKRLRKPKLTDEQVEEIKRDFENKKPVLQKELDRLLPIYRKKSWREPSLIGLYYKQTKDKWNVSGTLIAGIIKGTHRKCPLPSLCQS